MALSSLADATEQSAIDFGRCFASDRDARDGVYDPTGFSRHPCPCGWVLMSALGRKVGQCFHRAHPPALSCSRDPRNSPHGGTSHCIPGLVLAAGGGGWLGGEGVLLSWGGCNLLRRLPTDP